MRATCNVTICTRFIVVWYAESQNESLMAGKRNTPNTALNRSAGRDGHTARKFGTSHVVQTPPSRRPRAPFPRKRRAKHGPAAEARGPVVRAPGSKFRRLALGVLVLAARRCGSMATPRLQSTKTTMPLRLARARGLEEVPRGAAPSRGMYSVGNTSAPIARAFMSSSGCGCTRGFHGDACRLLSPDSNGSNVRPSQPHWMLALSRSRSSVYGEPDASRRAASGGTRPPRRAPQLLPAIFIVAETARSQFFPSGMPR